jgi:hypothetical protein
VTARSQEPGARSERDDLDELVCQVVVTAASRRAIERALLRRTLLHPTILVLTVLYAGSLLWFAASGAAQPIPVAVGLLVYAVGLPALVQVVVVRRTGRSASLGATMRSAFGADAVRIDDGVRSALLPYDAVHAVVRGRDVTWVRFGRPVERLVYPSALFPDEALTRLRAGRPIS